MRTRVDSRQPVDTEVFGEFSFPGDVAAGALADAYGLTLSEAERGRTLDLLLRQNLLRHINRHLGEGVDIIGGRPESAIGHRNDAGINRAKDRPGHECDPGCQPHGLIRMSPGRSVQP